MKLNTDDVVEVLEFDTVERDTVGKDKKVGKDKRLTLRAKVLINKTRSVGWVSTRSADGFNLLRPIKMQKLEVSGRSTFGAGGA